MLHYEKPHSKLFKKETNRKQNCSYQNIQQKKKKEERRTEMFIFNGFINNFIEVYLTLLYAKN